MCIWYSGSAARDERGVKRLLRRRRLIITWLCSTLVQLLPWDTQGLDGKLIQSGDKAQCFVSWPLWQVVSKYSNTFYRSNKICPIPWHKMTIILNSDVRSLLIETFLVCTNTKFM